LGTVVSYEVASAGIAASNFEACGRLYELYTFRRLLSFTYLTQSLTRKEMLPPAGRNGISLLPQARLLCA